MCEDGDCLSGVDLRNATISPAQITDYMLHFTCWLCSADHEMPFEEGASVQCPCGAGWYLEDDSLRLKDIPEHIRRDVTAQ